MNLEVDLEVERFYLYKLWVTGAREFYIGVTDNPVARKSQHLSAIYSLLRPLKLNKPVIAKIPAHIVFAKMLLKYKKILQIDCGLKKKINFKILVEVRTANEAKTTEANLLNFFSGNKFCLNSTFKSNYYGKRNSRY